MVTPLDTVSAVAEVAKLDKPLNGVDRVAPVPPPPPAACVVAVTSAEAGLTPTALFATTR